MEKKLLALVFLLFALPTLAVVPSKIGYGGSLFYINNTAYNGSVTATFRIYDAQTGGNLLWNETQTINITSGVFSTLLGQSSPINITFDNLTWLEVVMGGETFSPRTTMAASPYSLTANQTFYTKANSYTALGNITPSNNNATNLGSASLNWLNAYIANVSADKILTGIWQATPIGQAYIAGISIPAANLTTQILQSQIAGITLPFANITGFVPQSQISGITLPAANLSGFVSQSQISGITIPLANASWNGITLSTANLTGFIAQSSISGITLPFANITGQVPQSQIAGITLPAANITNATFSTGNGLLFVFPNNLTVNGNVSALNNIQASWNITALDRLIGNGALINSINATAITTQILQSQIAGITIPASNVTAKENSTLLSALNVTNGTFSTNNGLLFTFPNNLTVNGNITIGGVNNYLIANASLLYEINTTAFKGFVSQSQISGITIPLANASWNGITLSTANLTGFIAQSSISGITLPVANVTNKENSTLLSALNITNGTFSTNNGLLFTFPNNLTINGNVTLSGLTNSFIGTHVGDGSALNTLNATAITSGFISQARISGITLPAANVTAGVFPTGAYNFTGNTSWGIPSGQNQVCLERIIGTQVNYTKCFNNTHIIETIGVFVVP